MTVGSGSKALQQFPNSSVSASRDEGQATLLGPKNQAELQTSAKLEIISSKPANA
jgi:hypothetical protein